MRRSSTVAVLLILITVVASCSRRQPPIVAPAPAPVATPPAVTTPPPAPPPQRVEEALPVPPEPLSEDAIANRSLDDLNRDSPFRPVFFELDEIRFRGIGAPIAQTEVVFRSAALVAVALDGDAHAGPTLHVGGIRRQRCPAIV